MTGGGDGDYTPHPGDPWHPEWDPERSPRDEEFVPDREVREPRSGRRGLFRRRHAEPEPDLPPELPVEEAPAELVGEDAGGSVDVYEALRAEAPPVAPPPPPVPAATAETATVASDADIQWGEAAPSIDLAGAARAAARPPAAPPQPAPVAEASPVAVEPDPAVEAARRAAEEAARVEAERQAQEEAARAEAERRAQEQAARAEAERLAAEASPVAVEPDPAVEAAQRAVEEAARAEAERRAQEEAARAEAERLAAGASPVAVEPDPAVEAAQRAAEDAARVEAERRAQEEAARAEAERRAQEEAARAEAERLAAEEAARAEAERRAQEQAARAEAERQAQEEAARAEAERLAAEEAERAAAAEAERLAAEEAARAEAERLAAEEAERAAAAEAERLASEEAAQAEDAEWREPQAIDAEPAEVSAAPVAEEQAEAELLAAEEPPVEPEPVEVLHAAADEVEPDTLEPAAETDDAEAEAERLAEEAWRRAEAEFGAPVTIDDDVELDDWRDFADAEPTVAPAAEAVADVELAPDAARRRWWRRREQPEAEPVSEDAAAGEEAVAELQPVAEPLVPVEPEPGIESADLAEPDLAEPDLAEPEPVEAVADETTADLEAFEPVTLESGAAEVVEAPPPRRSWWRRAFGLPPPEAAPPVEPTLVEPYEETEPVAVFPPSPPADAEEAVPWWQSAATPAADAEDAAAEGEPGAVSEDTAEPVELEAAEAEHATAPLEVDAAGLDELEAADADDEPAPFEAAWEEEPALDETWAAAASQPAGLEPVVDPLAAEPLVEAEEEAPPGPEAEAAPGGRVRRWWRRVFALEPPETLVDEDVPEPVAADTLAAADDAAADEEALEVDDPLATAWAEQPMPVVDFPEVTEPAADAAADEGAEADAWLTFGEEEPAEMPAPGASWPALDGEGVSDEPPAGEELLAEVPDLPDWAEPAAADAAGADEPAAEPEVEAPVPDAGREDVLAGVAAFDVSTGDDDEFRLAEISEEHYYLQGTTQEHLGLAESVAAAAEQQGELQAVAAAIPGVETGVVGFDDVSADTYQTEDEEDAEVAAAAARRGSELTLRVVTGLLLVGLFVGALWWSATALSVLMVVVVLVALGEFYAVMIRERYQPLTLFGLVGGAVALLGARVWGVIAVPGALMLTVTLVFFYYAMSPHRRAPLLNGAVTLTGVAWVTGLAAFLMPLLDVADYKVLVFAVVMITVFTDVGSYFTGRSRGRRKLAPVISPGKTIEGLIGGTIAAIGIGAAIGQLDPLTTADGIILGATIAAVAPLGDLSVSMLKRSLGIKHMSGILPGHGGLLDRVDGLLFAVPAAWLVFSWLGLLG